MSDTTVDTICLAAVVMVTVTVVAGGTSALITAVGASVLTAAAFFVLVFAFSRLVESAERWETRHSSPSDSPPTAAGSAGRSTTTAHPHSRPGNTT